ncbi:conserved hypothetical protein [metagenome]|uniref:Stress-response A/B barrel domain-containing protein n=1 Tax=metagenome TaxID=256318 RepID=A0A2P2C0J3_9ZZZZ
MIKHVVAFGLNEAGQQNLAEMKSRLEGLLDLVPHVTSLAFGSDLGVVAGHWDAALVSEHADSFELESYQRHPAHVEVLGWLADKVTDRAVVDFMFESTT